jgi:hypothetical protein
MPTFLVIDKLLATSCKLTVIEGIANTRRSLLGAFADLWHLMQTPYSKEYVNLHQIPNLGKIARKSIGRIVLQFPL